MINFLRQSWGTKIKYYFWVCLKVFPDKISIWIRVLSKTDYLPQCGGHHTIPWGPKQNKGRTRRNSSPLPHTARAGTFHLTFSCLQTSNWNLHHQLSWLSGLQTTVSDWITVPAFLGLQVTDSTSWDFSASVTSTVNLNYAHPCAQTHTPHWFCLRILANTLKVHRNLPWVNNILKSTCLLSCITPLIDFRFMSVEWRIGNYILFKCHRKF